MRISRALIGVAATLAASAVSAQNESTLRQFFEGMTVSVKIDMPASQVGVDVHPDRSMPVDFRKLAQNLKLYGTGVHQGGSIMVTKVHVKKHHIEFQLGGGGFGTFADNMATASTTPTYYYAGKSQREKDVNNELKVTTDSDRRKELKAEQDDLRRDRNKDNAWMSAMNSQAAQQQEQNEREKRGQSGSRFNVRYDDAYPPGALTQDGIMAALAKYVAFPGHENEPTGATTPDTSGTALKKGLTVAQVEQILGPALTAAQEKEGSLDIMKRDYSMDGQRFATKFVGGILIDYTITPEN